MEPRVQTRAQTIVLGDDGIFRARSVPGTEIHLADAVEIIRALTVLGGGETRPILVDLSGVRAISGEARAYFAGPETAKVESAAGLMVSSPLTRVIGNFFMGLNKPRIPARLFQHETEALAWLRGFLR